MPPIDNNLAFFHLLRLYFCLFFWGCPCGLWPWVGLYRSSQVCSAVIPFGHRTAAFSLVVAFFRCAQKSSVWPSATAIYPSARFNGAALAIFAIKASIFKSGYYLRPFGPAKPFIGPRLPQPLLLASPLPLSGLVMRSSAAVGGRPKAFEAKRKSLQGRADLRAA
ncbi:hypothetical protein SGRA_4043 [Saprospira grandis str. Lewin]|uniref:Uncharacterized protein n=1 Tax=Saprospira grandis (strain Lewin) TaxID=984262 RepID=H6L8N3_SAPGL|nr:hypothetical protein SGRA_4043 [Saprospira grandis str. Lewin]